MPHHKPQFVAQVVKDVLFVNAAAPHAQHIEVAVFGKRCKSAVFVIGNNSRKTLYGNPVTALYKHVDAVNFQLVTIQCVTLWLFRKAYGTVRKASAFYGDYFAVALQLDTVIVQRLFPVSDRPPQLCRLVDKTSKILFADNFHRFLRVGFGERLVRYVKMQFIVKLFFVTTLYHYTERVVSAVDIVV